MVEGPALGLGGHFVGRLSSAHRPAVPSPELERLLEQALAAGRATWPSVALDGGDFVAHLAAHVPKNAELAAWLAGVFAADLYLACACARGDARALVCFERQFLASVGRSWSSQHRLAGVVEDVQQALRERLLVGRDGHPPRIAGYSGRGPLGAWVRMAATRLALNLQQRERAHEPLDDELVGGSPGPDPELEYLKTRYGAELKEAFRLTLEALPARAASVLRLHYQEGMTVDAIGTMYRASGRTVQRWLAEARTTILAETRRLLRERLGLPESQVDSLITFVKSRLDLSVYRYLHEQTDE